MPTHTNLKPHQHCVNKTHFSTECLLFTFFLSLGTVDLLTALKLSYSPANSLANEPDPPPLPPHPLKNLQSLARSAD